MENCGIIYIMIGGFSMLNFIVCEDNITIQNEIVKIINMQMIKSEIEYKIYRYNDTTKELYQFINSNNGPNIYILDIELPNGSGLDIARAIRYNDWNSSIIILSAHYELSNLVYKSRLQILDFVSKFDDYKNNIDELVELALKSVGKKKIFRFTNNDITYMLEINNIDYIVKESGENKVTISMSNGKKYQTNKTLLEVKKEIGSDFYQSHRSCIVNSSNIDKIINNKNVICFKGGQQTDLLSRNYRKGLKKYVGSC